MARYGCWPLPLRTAEIEQLLQPYINHPKRWWIDAVVVADALEQAERERWDIRPVNLSRGL